MIKKYVVIALAIFAVLPAYHTATFSQNVSQNIFHDDNNAEDYNGEKDITIHQGYDFKLLPQQFGAYIYTKCNGIEKKTPLLQAIMQPIDVDNNASTGEDGKDVKISAFIFPYVQQVDGKWVLAISDVLKIIRLGDEIKNSDFEAYVEVSFNYNGGQTFRVGLGSGYGEELPREMRIVFTVVPYIMQDKNPEFYLNTEPVYDSNEKGGNISIFGEYFGKSHEYIQIDYQPAIAGMIKVVPNIELGNMSFSIQRLSSQDTILTIRYEGKIKANITIDKIPSEMNFELLFSENHFEYSSNNEFNVTMAIEVVDKFTGVMKIIYLPRHIAIDGGLEGYMSIYVDNKKTRLILSDKFSNPSTYFMIGNISGEATLQWQIEKEGFIRLDGAKDAKMELYAGLGNMKFKMDSIQKAEHFYFGWNMSDEGYIKIDTDWEWLNDFTMNATFGDTSGILIDAGFFRAENYEISWVFDPISFNKQGNIEFMGDFRFSLMINGVWHNITP